MPDTPAPDYNISHSARSVPLEVIAPDPKQPRRHFDDDALAELGESIIQNGLIQPIVIRPVPREAEQPDLVARYWIIAGERRYRAALKAGLRTIDAIVRLDMRKSDVRILQVLENLQREDLTLDETCAAVRVLVDELGNAGAAARLGKSPAWISKHARLQELPEAITGLVESGHITSVDIAHDLARLSELDPDEATDVLEAIAEPDKHEPVNRAYIRRQIEWAEADLDRKRRQEEAAAAQPHRADNKASEGAPPDEDPKAAEARAREREIARVKDARKDLRTDALERLWKALKLKGSPAQSGLDRAAIAIEYGQTDFPGYWSTSNDFPKSADACTYRFSLYPRADVELAGRILAGLPKQPLLRCLLPPLTLDQARRLVAALPDALDGISLSADIQLKGKQLTAYVARTEANSKLGGDRARGYLAELRHHPDAGLNWWLRCRITQGEAGDKVKAADAYALYAQDCEAVGVEPIPFTSSQWGECVTEAGIQKKRIKTGVHYLGVQLIN